MDDKHDNRQIRWQIGKYILYRETDTERKTERYR